MRKSKWVLILTTIIFFGCAQNKNAKVEVSPKATEAHKQPVINLNPLPAPPPTFKEVAQEKLHEGEDVIVNLSFDNLDIKKVLLSLSKATNYNFIIDPEISGNVTIELKNVTLKEALDSVLSPFGYSYTFEGKNVRVLAKKTAILHIDVPFTTRGFTSDIQASIGGTSSSGSSSEEGASTSTGTTNMQVTNKATLDFWQSLDKTIKSIIGDDKTTTYTIEPISGTVIISGLPKTVEKVKDFVNNLNKVINRQVLIEAKIVEVNLNRNAETGINWQVLGDYKNYTYNIKFNSGKPAEKPLQIKVLKFSKDFSTLIGLLSKYGKVNVLSSPRLLAMNNQPAIIKVGRDYITIYKSQQTTTTTAGGETASVMATEEVETQTVLTEGIVLTIIPKIDANGNIILNITPAISSLETPIISGSSGETSEFLNKVFAVNVRQLNAMVKVKDGETVILGGLIAKRKSKEETGVPVMKDLPLIGTAFKSTKSESSKSELVIMLTPHLEK